MEPDHVESYALTGDHRDLRPAHRSCNRRAGGQLRRELAGLPPGEVAPSLSAVGAPTSAGLGDQSCEVWAVSWLSDLRRVPKSATWPRLMSAPHPAATGSYGRRYEKWVREELGIRLRWWQRLVARRLLEHDRRGRLVWSQALVTLARQLGKSFGVPPLCLWRLEHPDLFDGTPQDVVSVANKWQTARTLQARSRAWAKERPARFKVYDNALTTGIVRREDMAGWMVKAAESTHSMSNCLAVVDEVWNVRASDVDDGIEPTVMARDQSQLYLLSTAHPKASAVFLNRRAAALRLLATPADDLLVEWSADPALDPGDRAAWVQASPHWDDKRESRIAAAFQRATAAGEHDADDIDPLVSFACQYLNQWPTTVYRRARGEPLVDPGQWRRATAGPVAIDPDSPLRVAVEDNYGNGAAVAACARTVGGQLLVMGQSFDTWTEALTYVSSLVDDVEDARVVVGASLLTDPGWKALPVPVSAAAPADLRAGLSSFRALVGADAVVHTGTDDVIDQVATCRVVAGINNLTMVRTGRADLARAIVWAVHAAATKPGADVAIG